MRHAEAIAVVMLAGFPLSGAARAASAPAIVVPAGSLGDAVAALGAQAGVSIGLTDPVLQRAPVRGVRGRRTVAAALAALLRGLPARAEQIDADTWRIVRFASVPPHDPAPSVRRADVLPQPDIVVTASKRETGLPGYPGSAYLLAGGVLGAGAVGGGTDAILARLPTLASTALGPGRNKLFIRGIADSSFNGPSQATVGEYLGDVRLNYNAPDPDLTLADIASVEVLEGPQGTLYGAATLGGVLRIVPNPPRLDAAEAAIRAGVSATAHGKGSGDLTAVLNLPLEDDRIGLRAVGYRSVQGGYIDDPGRGLHDVNRTRVQGGRATLRLAPGGGWTIDLGGAVQATDSRDGQYAERDVGRLARRSTLAQPFDNDLGLASVTATRATGKTVLRMSGGMVAQDLKSRFDFSPSPARPTAFDESDRIRLFSGEVSLARRSADGVGWIVGASGLYDSERLTRNLGALPDPPRILGVRNAITNASAFAEAGIRLSATLVATGGLRMDFAHLVGEGLDKPASRADEPKRNEASFLPTAAVTWRPAPGISVFGRYQEGFRPGGLSVAAGSASVQRFHGDSLATAEIGTRVSDLAGSGVSGSLSVSYAHWENIQADLIDDAGLPSTANIGTGRIWGLEAQLARAILPGVRGEVALFLNRSRLVTPASFLEANEDSALPNVAKAGARAALTLDTAFSQHLRLTGDVALRYVGHSRLGIGPQLGMLQGDYADAGAMLRLGTDWLGVSLDLSNLLDARGDRFALGDPFDVADRRQVVPLRPRTIRIGVDAHF